MMLLIANGIWAQAPTAYAVFCGNDNSLHFLYCTESELDEKLSGQVNLSWTGDEVLNSGDSPGWANYNTNIPKVVFDESFKEAKPVSCKNWFYNFGNITEIKGLEYLNTSAVTTTENMFYHCYNLTSLDLSCFDTSAVTNMSSMFNRCWGLSTLNLSSFDTSAVTKMNSMFWGCAGLTSIIWGEFNTSNVTDMASMFNSCYILATLDLTNFDTSKVTDMESMFCNCYLLPTLDLSNFYTSNVTNMKSMFRSCDKLVFLNLSNFNISNSTDCDEMFYGCSGLNSLDLSNVDESSFSKIINVIKYSKPVVYAPAGTENTADGICTVVSKKDDGGWFCENFVISNDLAIMSIPYKITANTVKIERSFTNEKPYTLYLPFAMNAMKYGTFYTYSGYSSKDGTVMFNKLTGTETTPNTPYLFIPNKDYNEGITVEGGTDVVPTPTETTEPEYGLVGVYEKKTFTYDEVNEGIYS